MKNDKVTIKEAVIFLAIGIIIFVLGAVSWITSGEIELTLLVFGAVCFIIGVILLIVSLITGRKSKTENSGKTNKSNNN